MEDRETGAAGRTGYWRVQGDSDRLSRAFRSHVHDGSGHEEGTSCCASLEELVQWAHEYGCAPHGAIEIVHFEGEEISVGRDGEPVVLPSVEIARWYHPRWSVTSWTGFSATSPADLTEAGWQDSPIMEIGE